MADDNSDREKRLIKFSTDIHEVIGNSFPHKDKLREMGCKWNPASKVWYRESNFTDVEDNIIDEMNLKIIQISKINEMYIKINDLRDIIGETASIYSLGIIMNLEPPRQFSKGDAKIGYFQRFLLVDRTSYVQCIAWDKVGIEILEESTPIFIRNAYSKVREGKNELHCGNRTRINKLVDPELPNEIIHGIYTDWIRNSSIEIASLEENEYQQFVGMITEVFSIRDYLACPICSSGITEENIRCTKCDKEVSPGIRLILSIILEDNTNAIKATFFGEIAENLLNLSENEIDGIKELSMLNRIDSELLVNKINEIIGTRVILEGKIERNEYTELLEMNVNRIIPPSGLIRGSSL